MLEALESKTLIDYQAINCTNLQLISKSTEPTHFKIIHCSNYANYTPENVCRSHLDLVYEAESDST